MKPDPNWRVVQSSKEPRATDTRCPKKFNCRGALVNVTHSMAERLGHIILKCDKCGLSWSISVVEQKDVGVFAC